MECQANADCPDGEKCTTSSETCDATNVCTYAANTTPTTELSASGCRVLERDTTACQASRVAAGISGAWLKFSCRVALSKVTVNNKSMVQAVADSLPDMHSKYYTDAGAFAACHESDSTTTYPDPNNIVAQDIVMDVPTAPASNGTMVVPGGIVGLALNGVAIFNDSAGPNTSIYTEEGSFDRCRGHPNSSGVYHYHEEPYSLTQEDDNLVGVMRDGYFIYGRKDPDGSEPGLPDGGLSYPYYGHTGYTVDSPSTPVFHYHVHWEGDDAGNSGFFVTPGEFFGTMAPCTNNFPDGGSTHC